MFFKTRKASKQKAYKNEAAIPVQFYTNENGETDDIMMTSPERARHEQ